jgi:hypothetical protein
MPKVLSEKARALRNAYQRRWFADHPGKHSEYNTRFWEKQAAKDQAKNSKSG